MAAAVRFLDPIGLGKEDAMSPKQAKLAFVAVAAVLAFTAFASGDARAQGFNVHEFACTTSPFGVEMDVRGLGNTNVCVEGSADVDLNCACAGGGGNCPSDAKKQTIPTTVTSNISLEPKNGRVVTTFTLPFNPSDGLCTEPQCGSGQKTKLISWATPEGGAEFTLCTTTAAPGQPCSCEGAEEEDILATQTCGPTSDIVFAGKHGSCAALF
jgi:hypothetical protein